MPQFMPFMWIFLLFMVICLIVIMCFLYDNLFMNKCFSDKESNNVMMKINWESESKW